MVEDGYGGMELDMEELKEILATPREREGIKGVEVRVEEKEPDLYKFSISFHTKTDG